MHLQPTITMQLPMSVYFSNVTQRDPTRQDVRYTESLYIALRVALVSNASSIIVQLLDTDSTITAYPFTNWYRRTR